MQRHKKTHGPWAKHQTKRRGGTHGTEAVPRETSTCQCGDPAIAAVEGRQVVDVCTGSVDNTSCICKRLPYGVRDLRTMVLNRISAQCLVFSNRIRISVQQSCLHHPISPYQTSAIDRYHRPLYNVSDCIKFVVQIPAENLYAESLYRQDIARPLCLWIGVVSAQISRLDPQDLVLQVSAGICRYLEIYLLFSVQTDFRFF